MISHLIPSMRRARPCLGALRGGRRRYRRTVQIDGEWAGEPMALFLGNYANKVDRKGRVSVPAQFRAALAGASGIVAFPSFKEPVIEIFSEADMARMAE